MKYLIALLAMLPAIALSAGTTATVEFSPVAQYTDNTPLPTSDILKYTVKWQGGSQDSAAPQACVDKPGKLCVEVPVPCGDRIFTITVTPKPTAKYPVVSDDSNAFGYSSGVVCRPKAPTGGAAS